MHREEVDGDTGEPAKYRGRFVVAGLKKPSFFTENLRSKEVRASSGMYIRMRPTLLIQRKMRFE
jgi:hypothetical protein